MLEFKITCQIRSWRRLQNSPPFCVFKYLQTIKQKVWSEAENGERDRRETLFSLASHVLRVCEARALRACETSNARLNDFEEKKPTVLQSIAGKAARRTRAKETRFLSLKTAQNLSKMTAPRPWAVYLN